MRRCGPPKVIGGYPPYPGPSRSLAAKFRPYPHRGNRHNVARVWLFQSEAPPAAARRAPATRDRTRTAARQRPRCDPAGAATPAGSHRGTPGPAAAHPRTRRAGQLD